MAITPPYSKPILKARRAGRHPAGLTINFGEFVRANISTRDRICVVPDDFEAGLYKFDVVYGLPLLVCNYEPERVPLFLSLVIDLARRTAPIFVADPPQPDANYWLTADEYILLARCSKRLHDIAAAFSRDDEANYAARERRLYDDRGYLN